MPSSIIGTIVIGFLVGLLARALTPGRGPSGCILTILLGIAGAFVATWLGQQFGFYGPGQKAGFIGATVGAVIVLLLYGAVARRGR